MVGRAARRRRGGGYLIARFSVGRPKRRTPAASSRARLATALDVGVIDRASGLGVHRLGAVVVDGILDSRARRSHSSSRRPAQAAAGSRRGSWRVHCVHRGARLGSRWRRGRRWWTGGNLGRSPGA